MFQKFFTKTIESKFINNLLYNTPLPTFKCVREDDYILNGIRYIYRDMLIECTKSGYINSSKEPLAAYTKIDNYAFGKDYPQFTERYISEFGYYDTGTHEQLGKYLRYVRNLFDVDLMPFYNCYSNRLAENFYIKRENLILKEIENQQLTIPAGNAIENPVANSSKKGSKKAKAAIIDSNGNWQYDVVLQKWFIDLEFTKKPYPINSVEFSYVVYQYKFISERLRIYTDNLPTVQGTATIIYNDIVKPSYLLMNSSNSDYKVLQIPINFNQDYTIAIDTDCEMLLVPAIIDNGRFVTILDSNKTKLDLTELLDRGATLKNGSKFRHPFTYRLDLTTANKYANYLELNEKNLYLLIQLPATESSSIVVLEGDYTGYPLCTKYYDSSITTDWAPKDQDKVFLSALSLLKLNDHTSYAFSDRLIEFLTLNVINPLDEIDDNVKAVQEAQNLIDERVVTPGVWSDIIRSYYYRLMMGNNKIEHYDLTGYIDKDTEKLYVK